MAKDLGNDIDLTLGTGPETLGTAAEYTPPSRYDKAVAPQNNRQGWRAKWAFSESDARANEALCFAIS